jgi:hypothetical protein
MDPKILTTQTRKSDAQPKRHGARKFSSHTRPRRTDAKALTNQTSLLMGFGISPNILTDNLVNVMGSRKDVGSFQYFVAYLIRVNRHEIPHQADLYDDGFVYASKI